VVSGTKRFNVEAGGAFKSLDTIRNLPLRSNEGTILRVGDVADVFWGAEETRSHVYHNGKRAIWITANQKGGTDATKLRNALIDELENQKKCSRRTSMWCCNSTRAATSQKGSRTGARFSWRWRWC
jgi:multidrug efflux pump subunit AcrB